MALAHSDPSQRRATEHSYLLRVVIGVAGGRRYVLQDLRSGERRNFDSEAQLRRFLNRSRSLRLR